MPQDDQDEIELQVTDLRPPRLKSGVRRHVRMNARTWRWAAVGISLALTLVVILSSVPTAREGFTRLFASPTATTSIGAVSSIHVEPGTRIDQPMPTPIPSVTGIPSLGRAPKSCPQKAAKPQFVGPGYGQAIGGPSIWVTGFTGTYPTLALRGASEGSSDPYGWPLRHTQYGWPAPIVIVLAHSVKVPVTLYGSDIRNNQPLWFGFASGGVPPAHIDMSLTLDLSDPELPPYGYDATGMFWSAYIFLPREGCYELAARPLGNTSDGAWSAMFSAGR